MVEPIKHRIASQLKNRRAPKRPEVRLFDDTNTPLKALMSVFDGLVPLAVEWHAPIPKGLSAGMTEAIQRQKHAVQLRFERQLGAVDGYANALASAGRITSDQLHDVVASTHLLVQGRFPEPEADPPVEPDAHCTHPHDSWADCNGSKQCQHCGHVLTNDEILKYEARSDARGQGDAVVDQKKPSHDAAHDGGAG